MGILIDSVTIASRGTDGEEEHLLAVGRVHFGGLHIGAGSLVNLEDAQYGEYAEYAANGAEMFHF